jgi:putative Holliday junction resolvase
VPTPAPTRVLGLDVGDRRIGIAISDELRTIAQPVATLTRTSRRYDLRYFDRLLRLRPFAEIVVGLPLYPSGDRSPQAAKAETFAAQLGEHLGLPIHMWTNASPPPRPTVISTQPAAPAPPANKSSTRSPPS